MGTLVLHMQGTEFCSQLCGNLLQQQWKNYERLKTPGPSDQLSDQLLSPEDTMRERTDISDHMVQQVVVLGGGSSVRFISCFGYYLWGAHEVSRRGVLEVSWLGDVGKSSKRLEEGLLKKTPKEWVRSEGSRGGQGGREQHVQSDRRTRGRTWGHLRRGKKFDITSI